MAGTWDHEPERAPVPSERDWKRLRFQRHRLGRGDFRDDIGGVPGTVALVSAPWPPRLTYRVGDPGDECDPSGDTFDPAQAGSA